jgi:hypothetical protein
MLYDVAYTPTKTGVVKKRQAVSADTVREMVMRMKPGDQITIGRLELLKQGGKDGEAGEVELADVHPLPAVTVVPRAEPPTEWYREPQGYREALIDSDDLDMADDQRHQEYDREAG